MSNKVIKIFLQSYQDIISTNKNIKMFPYPKHLINTNKDILKYKTTIETYVKDRKLSQNTHQLENVKTKFPKEYFNYECM